MANRWHVARKIDADAFKLLVHVDPADLATARKAAQAGGKAEPGAKFVAVKLDTEVFEYWVTPTLERIR